MKKLITAIVATDSIGGIAKYSESLGKYIIPWDCPIDRKIFKEIITDGCFPPTLEHNALIMGNGTYNAMGVKGSFPSTFYIVHRDDNIEDLLEELQNDDSIEKIFILGGEKIYERFMPYVDEIIMGIRKHFAGSPDSVIEKITIVVYSNKEFRSAMTKKLSDLK